MALSYLSVVLWWGWWSWCALVLAVRGEIVALELDVWESLDFSILNEDSAELVYFVLSTRNDTTNTSVDVSLLFCLQCGAWKLFYRKTLLPNFDNYDDMVSGDNTGNELAPFSGTFFNITLDPSAPTTHYLAFHFQFIGCKFQINPSNVTKRQQQPPLPQPGNHGTLSGYRNGGSVHVEFSPANDSSKDAVLLYKPFIQRSFLGIAGEADWCDWSEISIDWTVGVTKFDFVVSEFDDVIVTVAVRNINVNSSMFYKRIHVSSTKENVVRTAGEILIAFMLIIPLVILYSGYSRKLGIKFLAFQFISMTYDVKDVTKKKPVEPKEAPKEEDDEVVLEQDLDDRIESESSSSSSRESSNTDNEETSETLENGTITALPDSKKDIALRKASRHMTILIIIQATLILIAVIISLSAKSKIDLDVIFSAFFLPIFIFGLIGSNQFSKRKLLCYMVSILWLTGLQITRMLFEMNFGDRTGSQIFFNKESFQVYGVTSDSTDTLVAILIQILIFLSVILMISSLSPASFIVMKNNTIDREQLKFTKIHNILIGLTFGNIITNMIWVVLVLHYVPTFGYSINWSDFFRLFTEIQITMSLALLSIFCTLAALFHYLPFCVISIIVVAAQFSYSIFMISVDRSFVKYIYEAVPSDVWIAVTVFRVFALIIQIGLIISCCYFFMHIRAAPIYFEIKHLLNNYGRGYNCLYVSRFIHSIILAPVVSIIGVILIGCKLSLDNDTFPPLYMSYYWFMLSCPIAIISETHFSLPYLIYSILVDGVGIFILFYVLVPGPWVVLLILPILKILVAIISSSASCCCSKKESEKAANDSEGFSDSEEKESFDTLDLGQGANIARPKDELSDSKSNEEEMELSDDEVEGSSSEQNLW